MTRKSLSIFSLALFVFCFLFSSDISAQEITILYTGETHAMLYPCNCHYQSDGGIARRATLIKELRKDSPDLLLLDSGGFFAGGLQDEYTQNTELDMQRSIVNLEAMELMKYDAATVGDDEFNFGMEFLQDNVGKTRIAFLSSNICAEGAGVPLLKPYIIKESAGRKIGIIGLTNSLAEQKAGASGMRFIDPKTAVKEAVSELKKNRVDLIILISHLGESEDLSLLKEVEGIGILIVGHSRTKKDIFSKEGAVLILRPSWQGRGIGKLTMDLNDNKVANYRVEELRLSDKISDDPDILSILPRCFSDNNCKQEGSVGRCDSPGILQARCVFTKAVKVPLSIITSKLCSTCYTKDKESLLKTYFPGLSVSYLYYPGKEADRLIKDLGIDVLPVYLLGKEAEEGGGFGKLKNNLQAKGDFYMLNPSFSGIAYYLDRKPVKGRLDLFMSLYHKDARALLNTIREFNPIVHFLVVEKAGGKFEAKGGNLEVEECLRSVCVQKYYPQEFWNYISCRVNSINSSWWQDCLGEADTDKISICARGEEGNRLLRENIALSEELQIMLGPAYLLDNREIFSSHGVPVKEELKKIIKR
ncbi:MAG: hypothetical protein ABH806_01230 [Candidatus Omnitrophota bacterium]